MPLSRRPRPSRFAGVVALAALGLTGARCWGRGAAPASAPVSGAEIAAPAEQADAPLDQAPDGRPLRLTFEDDFTRFDPRCGQPARWRSAFGDGREDGVGKRTLESNGERQVYVDRCFLAQAGSPFAGRSPGLDILADRALPALRPRLGGRPYVSGVITTQPTFSQAYGYFEMRARLPRGKGLWPAFWLLPADLSWPPEIDVVESIGDPSTGVATVHSKVADTPGSAFKISDPGAFHRYGVSWDPKMIVWYLDGRAVARKPTPPDVNKPMFMLLNLAVGGRWPGDPDEATPFPARFSIDWVRAYRFAR